MLKKILNEDICNNSIYNEDSFLEKSIDSFINQTYTKKIVYVNDNSTDSSKKLFLNTLKI